jgi:hypothetical protein
MAYEKAQGLAGLLRQIGFHGWLEITERSTFLGNGTTVTTTSVEETFQMLKLAVQQFGPSQ